MKMVKGLLLGSAAGIVAMTGAAQAADLPVKAKAVEYVRVCSIYGQGFYYMPGTDTCLKVGGYARMDVGFNAAGSHGPYMSGAQARDTRGDTPNYETRIRGIISWDARSQTEYGTLRAYIRAGWEQNSGDANYRGICYFDRAFIQFAGFTFGKTQSFFSFYANALNYSTLQGGGHSDAGLNLIAYTFQFAGGFSASISLEDDRHHRGGLWDAGTNALTIASTPGAVQGLTGPGDYAASTYPDIVANLRVDQPWGSAQISAAVHDVKAAYAGSTLLGGSAGSETGYAVQGGVKFNLPWAQGDEFWVQGTWARGATQYLGLSPFVHTGTQFAMYSGGPSGGCTGVVGAGPCGSAALAWTFDGLFSSTTNLELVEGWAINAAIQHYWTPSLRTSVFGHYTQIDYGGNATAIFCAGATGTAANNVTAIPAGCNPDFQIMQIGTRTIWTPVNNMDIGVEVLYSRLEQNHSGSWGLTSQGSRPAGTYTASDKDTWSGTLRFQRNFFP